MLITRKSPLSGKENTIDVPIDPEQYHKWNNTNVRYRRYIQDEFPTLSAELREFIKTGITPEEWNNMFGMNPFKK